MLSMYKFYVKPVLNQGKDYAMHRLQCLNAGASCKLKAGIAVASWKLLRCKLLTKIAAGNSS